MVPRNITPLRIAVPFWGQTTRMPSYCRPAARFEDKLLRFWVDSGIVPKTGLYTSSQFALKGLKDNPLGDEETSDWHETWRQKSGDCSNSHCCVIEGRWQIGVQGVPCKARGRTGRAQHDPTGTVPLGAQAARRWLTTPINISTIFLVATLGVSNRNGWQRCANINRIGWYLTLHNPSMYQVQHTAVFSFWEFSRRPGLRFRVKKE